jgi:23S rRNA (adenine2030-N6)-methyltransferase
VALKSLLPPPERRGLLLIDPPYEEPDEMARAVRAIDEAMKRFATGIVMLWYPIKVSGEHRTVHEALAGYRSLKALVAELSIRPEVEARGLNGCGLMIVNPPWPLKTELECLLPFLAERLAERPGGNHRLLEFGL